MMKKKRKTPPSIKAICEYWSDKLDETRMGADRSEWNINCWRCGNKHDLQKAHITPHALGGVNEPGNYVILCNDCHKECPDVNDKQFMIDWIYSTSSCANGFYKIKKAIDMHKDIYGCYPKVNGNILNNLKTLLNENIMHHSGSFSMASYCGFLHKMHDFAKNDDKSIEFRF